MLNCLVHLYKQFFFFLIHGEEVVLGTAGFINGENW